MKKALVFTLLLGLGLLLNGCCQNCGECYDDDLCTIPATNNPRLIPSSGGGMPGMPSPSSPH